MFIAVSKRARLNIAVCVDTSGSTAGEILDAFFEEINAMHENPRNVITVIECDRDVGHVYRYRGFRPKKAICWHQGGGTAYEPALIRANALRPKPDGILYFTDSWGKCPIGCTNIPVLWVIASGCDPERHTQFGRTVEITDLRRHNLATLLFELEDVGWRPK